MTLKKIGDLNNFYDLHNQDVTFYNQSKVALWSGYITNLMGASKTNRHYAWAKNVQSWNSDGSPRKNSAKKKSNVQIFPGYYYSYGLIPEGADHQFGDIAEKALTQEQIDAKLKEYAEQRIEQLMYVGQPGSGGPSNGTIRNWHMGEAFVQIFRELTE